METNWYAVYTRSRWEKKVSEQLNKLEIENYCPLNRVVRQWSDRKKVVEEPLFTSYVFVKISLSQMNQIRQVYGLVNFVYWLGKPAVIQDSEINLMSVRIHDMVKVLDGPFIEMEGTIISVKKNSVKVLLPSLRFFMTAEVEIQNVAKIQDHQAASKRITVNN
jgi:transcription antitermination factor NusG